ncbi:hypothetical protein CSZ94_08890 [Janthinobacterium sp. ROICE36]|uniref:DUF3016 domain-containing protein n=1 Tax=Janthinobacterium sp. ROICE36 TaxID=2048670 RepID=UPI000C7EA45F|nr:DUF3016 domain-containing protein [Janthinobacterium sp. ROICE36]PLY42964.1 hypothetical protein CSZ94_08890 [Janthinobacterium sp. ROICE36]
MQKQTTRALIAGLALLASSATWAATEVHFSKPDQFTDIPFNPQEREEVLKELSRHFEKLGASLPSGQNLKIDVTDVDLAGRENPSLRAGQDIRVMNGRVDWPRMRLHYVLEQDGKVLRSGDAALSDMSYLSRINHYFSNEKLRYEKLMIDDWYGDTFGIKVKRQARK